MTHIPITDEQSDTARKTNHQARLRRFIADNAFPCVGAKAALAQGTLGFWDASRIDSPCDDWRLHAELVRFAGQDTDSSTHFRSFAALFTGPGDLSESAFERAMWDRLESLSDIDRQRDHGYDPRVSSDPDSPDFALSFGGKAFFAVGLHPGASRPARRFHVPVIVFNPHEQFERLRAEGRYETMREKILIRDEAFSGSRNPMLARHGDRSEARQYSGRAVGAGWTCPFRRGLAR